MVFRLSLLGVREDSRGNSRKDVKMVPGIELSHANTLLDDILRVPLQTLSFELPGVAG
jgi:hypothetical protein